MPSGPAVTTLPHWEQATASQVYSSVPINTGHDDVSSNTSTLKSDQDNQSVHSGDRFEYAAAGNGDENMTFPITPPTSEQVPHDSQAAGELPPPKRQRIPVPDEKKDNKYWDRRKKNNQAAKRSRDSRKQRIETEIKTAKEAISENQKLKQEIDVLKAEINSLRRLLKDANMTLSLWIKARQASEPSSQLPPMLRGQNLSFVNFPVATTI